MSALTRSAFIAQRPCAGFHVSPHEYPNATENDNRQPRRFHKLLTSKGGEAGSDDLRRSALWHTNFYSRFLAAKQCLPEQRFHSRWPHRPLPL